jgi:hypothetical protein
MIVASTLIGREVSADISSVFFIAKSQNRNQVHYGVKLDAECNPVGAQPVFGYWLMLESRGQTEPLLSMEGPAYGLDEVQEIQRGVDSTAIRVKLRAFPDRPLSIVVGRAAGRCHAFATTPIAGVPAKLHSIYVRLKWPFGIDSVLVRGSSSADGRRVEEWVRDP